ERRTGLMDDACESCLTRCQGRGTIHDAAPVPSYCRFLHRRRVVWYDDVRRHPTQSCRQRYRCRMIARGVGGDPVPSFLLREAKNRVARPTELEGAPFLEILTFTKQHSANQVVQARTREYRRAVDIRLDTCSSGLHVCERGIWRHEPSFYG